MEIIREANYNEQIEYILGGIYVCTQRREKERERWRESEFCVKLCIAKRIEIEKLLSVNTSIKSKGRKNHNV